MENSSTTELFLDYFTQTKQRIDLDIEMQSTKIIGRTKLTFQLKKSLPNAELILRLNAENVIINKIYLYSEENKNSQVSESYYLLFHNSNPFYTKTYLETIYANIEDIDSFRNVNRVEWELRNEGNIVISITRDQMTRLMNGNNKKDQKIKIIIEYEVIENDIGVVFQLFLMKG